MAACLPIQRDVPVHPDRIVLIAEQRQSQRSDLILFYSADMLLGVGQLLYADGCRLLQLYFAV
jgi:hypothetical protein